MMRNCCNSDLTYVFTRWHCGYTLTTDDLYMQFDVSYNNYITHTVSTSVYTEATLVMKVAKQ